MKAHMLLSAVVLLSACTHATSVTAPPVLTSEWGVGEPASPIGDGTPHATEQVTNAVVSSGTVTTGATRTSHATAGAKASEVGDGDSTRGVVEHDTLPREVNFTPRPINTGDPCGDCARAR